MNPPHVHLFTMNHASKRGPERVATSSAFRGCRIGCADGIDRASHGYFTKRPFYFLKSTHAPQSLSVYFSKNTSYYFEINPQSTSDGLRGFSKKTFSLLKINPRSRDTQFFFCENILRFFSNQPAC
jgi:hypothetical protein